METGTRLRVPFSIIPLLLECSYLSPDDFPTGPIDAVRRGARLSKRRQQSLAVDASTEEAAGEMILLIDMRIAAVASILHLLHSLLVPSVSRSLSLSFVRMKRQA